MRIHTMLGYAALYLVVATDQKFPAEAQRSLPPQAVSPATEPGKVSAPQSDTCPLTVTIDAHGHLYDSRFHGSYRVSERTLAMDIAGGCKQAGPTSSVRVKAAPEVPYGRLKQVVDLIQKNGRLGLPVKIIAPPASHPAL